MTSYYVILMANFRNFALFSPIISELRFTTRKVFTESDRALHGRHSDNQLDYIRELFEEKNDYLCAFANFSGGSTYQSQNM